MQINNSSVQNYHSGGQNTNLLFSGPWENWKRSGKLATVASRRGVNESQLKNISRRLLGNRTGHDRENRLEQILTNNLNASTDSFKRARNAERQARTTTHQPSSSAAPPVSQSYAEFCAQNGYPRPLSSMPAPTITDAEREHARAQRDLQALQSRLPRRTTRPGPAPVISGPLPENRGTGLATETSPASRQTVPSYHSNPNSDPRNAASSPAPGYQSGQSDGSEPPPKITYRY
jgi:hypothetical protein